MSLNVNFKAKMGEVMLKQNDNLFAIDICQANATCAFIYKYKDLTGEANMCCKVSLQTSSISTTLSRKRPNYSTARF